MKKEKLFFIIAIICFVLLIASVITNVILIAKINNTNKADTNNTETQNNNDLIGVYYNEKNGKIELLDDKNCIYISTNNKECTYTIQGNKITFNYYTDLVKDTDGNCYYHYTDGNKDTTSCKETHNIDGTIVNNGIIITFTNSLFSKLS